MITGLWGRKIGMTQLFDESKVVPVTAIDTSHWFVTNVKTVERDGYNAVQIGRVRKKYEGKPFSADWLKKARYYFMHLKEIRENDSVQGLTVGQPAQLIAEFAKGTMVDAWGITRGRGFQGVVKRHGFAGGPDSHGSMFHRRPGTMSFMRSRGRVIKGKRLPGHMGVANRVMQNLEIMHIEPDANTVLVKGSIPGHSGSLVFLKRAGKIKRTGKK
jgi:large subunit ribosomal protein L3